MAVRESLARLFGAKASIIGLSAEELPDRALEKTYDDAALLSTYADDAWPYILATIEATQATQAHLTIGTVKRGKNGEEERTPSGQDHPVQQLFDRPSHPYTRQLLACIPKLGVVEERMRAIPGSVPPPSSWGQGCRFTSRCELARPDCTSSRPALREIAPSHRAACFLLEGATVQ